MRGGGWGGVLCVLSLISFWFLNFFFFALWLLPLYMDKMLSCVWKMVSGRNAVSAWHLYIGQRKFD